MVMASPVPGGGSGLLINLAKENQSKLLNVVLSMTTQTYFPAMSSLDFDSQSLSKMFQKVNGFFNKTGEIMRKVAEATDNDDIKDIGDKVVIKQNFDLILNSFQLMLKENDSFLRLFVDDDSVDEVTDGFRRFVGKN